jgi:hypothetical protein
VVLSPITAFIHGYFLWKSVGIDGLFEEGDGHRRFMTVLGKHEINGVAEFINDSI